MSDLFGAEGSQAQGAAPNAQTPARTESALSTDIPLPRPARQRRRAKADRGLPSDEELWQLAEEYLRAQRIHWPELAKAGLLPDGSHAVIVAMAEDFKDRHRTGHVDPVAVQQFRKLCPKLGGDYSRFSCDNSSPKSIIDQMVNGLDKARQEDRFVPWQYVFADYSVSGLNPSRQGYSSYKAVLQDKDHFIETTYIDDFSRASRDEVEWWRLAHLSRRMGKRMVGASDGFDLSAPNWDTMIAVYGLLSRLFIKGLREKVKRGMRGAARRRTCLGKLPLGFTRAVQRDDLGNVVRDRDGVPVYVPCVDPGTCDSRRLLYELFVVKCWSAYQITKHFNAIKVDGWGGWTEGGIKKLLWSASAVGVFIWNRTRREYDHEEERWMVVPNPRKDWVVYHDRNLAIVPMEWFTAARKKLSAMRRGSPITGRKLSRNERSASTLFSGTLFCGYCKQEIKLMRSAGKYKVMGCINGPTGKHACQLCTTKSTRIVEKSLLTYLLGRLMTGRDVEELVAKANAYLLEEASKPRADLAPLRAGIRRKEADIKTLFQRVERSGDEALVQAYERRISDIQKEVNELKNRLRVDEVQYAPPPPPLDLAAVMALLPDFAALLNQEIPAAAEAIRALTGRITIRQEKVPGKARGAKWIATFEPDFLGWLRQRAKSQDCPDSVTLEYLSARNWITPGTAEVTVDHIPKYEENAGKVRELAAKGASVNTIAEVLGTTWEVAKHARRFATTGERPKTKPPGRRTGKGDPRRKQVDGTEVVRLRDEQRLPFKDIARQKGASVKTIVKAYDQAKPEAVRDAADSGRRPQRGRYSHLGPEAVEAIWAGLRAGRRPKDIAAAVGCSIQTVDRIRKQLSAATELSNSRSTQPEPE